MSSTEQVIQRFQPISLAEMDGVKLQDRVDTKYIQAAGVVQTKRIIFKSEFEMMKTNGVMP